MSGTPAGVYPRAAPVRPPDDLLRWQTRLRRWTLLLVVGTAVALGLIVEANVFLVRRPEAPTAAAEPAPAPLPVVAERPPEPSSKPREEPTVPPDRILDVLGDLTATQLYQSHFNIGLLSDAMENGIYPEEQTRKYLDFVMQLVERADRQLADLADAGLRPEDRKRRDQARRVVAALRRESAALRGYWRTGDRDRADAFHKARLESAAAINELLGK